MTRGGRLVVVGVLGALCLLVALFALFDVIAPPIIEAMAAGRTVPALDTLLDAHRRVDPVHRDVAYYVRNGRTVLGRMLIATAGLALAAIGVARRRHVVAASRAFFTVSGPAINLAVFRIVLFTVFLVAVETTPVLFYSQLPPELLLPPRGLGWFPALLPMSAGVVAAVLLVFRVSCVAAIIGVFTRPATIIALLTGAYALAVAQLYGKLFADHHILWFAALLAASRCGDALSIDAIRAAWRSADGGVPTPLEPAQAYALPLRIVWLLMGVMYFFPGFWKLWRTGLAWVSADNLRHHMFLKWREFGDWTPLVRIDDVPLLLWMSALGTIAFELGFIVLVVSSRLRPLAFATGLVFHNLTWLLLRIPFGTLQAAYVALIDWAALLGRAGRRLFPEPLYVEYDGKSDTCRRTVAALRSLDLLERIVWVDHADDGEDLRAIRGRRVWRGYAAYQVIAGRIPPLWLVWPLLRLWPVTAVGLRVHDRVARRRTSAAVPTRAEHVPDPPAVPLWAPALLGTLLLVGSVATGTRLLRLSWPFTVYPTFASTPGMTRTDLAVRVSDASGLERSVDLRRLNAGLPRGLEPERLQGLMDEILATPDPRLRESQLLALWNVLARGDPTLRDVRVVRFFRDTLTTVPERRQENPLQRELVLEVRLWS